MVQTRQKPTWYIWLLVGLPIGAFIMFLFCKGCETPNKETVYKTDTLYRDRPLEIDTTTPTKEVPPKRVEIYDPLKWAVGELIDHEPIDQSYKYIDSNGNITVYWDTTDRDSIILVPLLSNDTDIEKWQRYYTNYPYAPKLIDGKLTGDTVEISLLDTSGFITKRVFPVFYDKYGYYLRDTKLLAFDKPGKRSDPIKTPNLSKLWTQGMIDASYSLIHGGFNASFDYSVMYNKVGIFGHTQLQTFPTYWDARVGIRYIWGSKRN